MSNIDGEKILTDLVAKKIGKYIPNQMDLIALSRYLYKIFLISFKDIDIKEESEKISYITEVDEESFSKAVKDIALFTSQMVIHETLDRVYKDIRQETPMVTVENTDSVRPTQVKKNVSNLSVEASFDIDISAVPKVDSSELRRAVEMSESRQVQTNRPKSFLIDDISIDGIDINKVNAMTNSYINENQGDSEDFRMGSGNAGSDTFKTEPRFSFGIDY